MIKKGQFGINKNDDLLKTFFSNDWQHSILLPAESDQVHRAFQSKAKAIIVSQVTLSVAALILSQG